MFRLIKRAVWLVVLVICLTIALPLFVGWYLSPQDPIEKADAIVTVSGGDNNARIKKTVELYKEGWSPIVIYSGAAAEGSISNAAAMRNISVKMGVPRSDILIEEDSKDTTENASFTAKIIKENNYKSIILVTSPYHQRRTVELFKKELGKDFKIINQSAIDEDWRKRGWWEDEQGRFLTIGELGKIFVNYIKTWRSGD
ncbi:MAG: YdcF family protein [Patescibacteria group bacterium]|nr:YdcF family protein [Patescibacteria group bacterium]